MRSTSLSASFASTALGAISAFLLLVGPAGASASVSATGADQIVRDTPSSGSTHGLSLKTLQADPAPSTPNESLIEQLIEGALVAFILVPLLLLLLTLLLAIPTSLLAVSLVLDGGCLRYLLFAMGWACTTVYGLLTGALVADAILGMNGLTELIAKAFLWGYPFVAWWGHKRLEAMPPEQYQAWKQSLTGGALLGFGAGSIAGLARSVGSGFGGFGGGSFGGGGASGSWSGASGAGGSVSSTAASSSASAGGAGTTGVGSTSLAASGATAALGATPSGAASTSSENPSQTSGIWARLKRWFHKFQWYHGVAFILVTLVFVPFGLGAVQALENTTVLVVALVAVVGYSAYRLIHSSAASTVTDRVVSSFRGGAGSSSWS